MSLFFFLSLIFILFFSVVIIGGMHFVSCFLSFKDFFKNKIVSYECGFSYFKFLPVFSVSFFLIIFIFIIFELEVIVFIFLVQNDFYSLLVFFLFFFYIIFSFYMEWFYGKLSWLI